MVCAHTHICVFIYGYALAAGSGHVISSAACQTQQPGWSSPHACSGDEEDPRATWTPCLGKWTTTPPLREGVLLCQPAPVWGLWQGMVLWGRCSEMGTSVAIPLCHYKSFCPPGHWEQGCPPLPPGGSQLSGPQAPWQVGFWCQAGAHRRRQEQGRKEGTPAISSLRQTWLNLDYRQIQEPSRTSGSYCVKIC